MSTTIMALCWPLKMSLAQKAVLISLADNANDHGECWPSVDLICKRTCLTDRGVQKAIKALSSMRLLTVEYRTGRSTKFLITPELYSPPNDVHPERRSPRGRTTFTPPPNDVHQPPNDVHPEPTRTAKEPSKEPSRAAERKPLTLPDWLPESTWRDWCDFRRTRKGWTPKAQELSLRTLDRLQRKGHDPTAVIEQSIERGWTGLFELHEANHADRSTGRNLSVVERVEASIIARRQREAAAVAAAVSGSA